MYHYHEGESHDPLAELPEAGGILPAAVHVPLVLLAAAGGSLPGESYWPGVAEAGGVLPGEAGCLGIPEAGGIQFAWTVHVPLVLLPVFCFDFGRATWRPRCPVWYGNTEQVATCGPCELGGAEIEPAETHWASVPPHPHAQAAQAAADAAALAAAQARLVCEPIPEPEWSLTVERREAAFALEGWPEYIASTPPRYYRVKVLGGPGLILDSHLASLDNCGDDIADRNVHIFSGEIAADVWGQPIAPHTGQERVENYQTGSLIFMGAADSEATSLGVFIEPRAGTAVDITATRIQVTGNGACVAHTQRTTGEIWEELTAEHTPCDALQETVDALPWYLRGEYTSGQAESGAIEAGTGAAWLNGENPRDWEGQQEQWAVHLSGLLPGRSYRVRWQVGDAWEEHAFTALTTVATVERVVPCGVVVQRWEADLVCP